MLGFMVALTLLGSGQSEPPAGPAGASPRRWPGSGRPPIRDLRYDLSFTIPGDRQAPVRGRAVVHLVLSAPQQLVFDFAQPADRVRAVRAGGRDAASGVVDGHIVVPAGMTAAGANRIEFEFIAGDEALNRNDEFLYTLFVPARAQLAFPCFDQPDLKARYTLSLDGARRLAGGRQRAESAQSRAASSGATSSSSPRRSRCRPICSRSPPEGSPSRPRTRDGRTLRMFHRETDAAKVARNRDAIFDLHARGAGVARGLHRDPVPVRQVRLRPDSVVSVRRHGARRRHPLQRSRACMLDESATQNQLLERASVDRARDRAHVVRRSRDDAVVQRRVDEGGVRQLHGGEDREPVVSRR